MNNQRETFSISKRCIDLQKERNDRKTEFSKFFSKNVKTCIYNNHKIDKRDVATMLGFSYEMFRKKVGGQKPISKRDLVVAICMVLKPMLLYECTECLSCKLQPESLKKIKHESISGTLFWLVF